VATNFPTSLDSLTNPTSTDSLTSPSHAGQHADANDAIEALQAKVGVNSSAVTTSLDYKVANVVPVGAVIPYAGSTAPTNWLLCAGQAISRSTYAALFTVVGTTYGTGDGSTTFNLPDLRGRVAAGKDDMNGTAASRLTNTVLSASNTLGATGGAQTVTLTSSEMPSHTHTQNAHGHVVSANSFAGDRQIVMGPLGGDGDKYGIADSTTDISSNTAVVYARNNTATNQNTGGGGAHTNTQPTLVLNYIIRALA
jgi:microcystin-dependent protein